MKQLEKWIFLQDSKFPGNTTTIMVWVHGNEKSGPNILNKLMKEIQIIQGKVYFIFANLEALQINKRYYEKNMNRCFFSNIKWNTYEDKRAKTIIKHLNKSDYLLDIHNTLNKLNSIPFLISEYSELWKLFPIKFVSSGFDKLHPGGSDGYMNSIWKIWLCVESGSIYDPNGPKIAKQSILNFLKFTKNIVWNPNKYAQQTTINFDFIYKNKSLNLQFRKKFRDFEKVRKGDILAYDGDNKILAPYNWYILFPYKANKIWEECFVLGRSKL